MSDQEYNQTAFIELTIRNRMAIIYWMVGGSMITMVTIFILVALPLQLKLIEVSEMQKTVLVTKANKSDVEESFKFAEKTYVDKAQYARCEKDEHRMMTILFSNPTTATYIFEQIHANTMAELGFNYVIRSEKK